MPWHTDKAKSIQGVLLPLWYNAPPHQPYLCSLTSSTDDLQPRKGCFEIQDQTGKTYVSLIVSGFTKVPTL